MRKLRRCILVLLILAVLLCFAVFDSQTRLVTDEFTVGNSLLPDAFEGFRIVHLSDLHATSFGEGNEKLLSAVRDAEPDIICVTGDMVDGPRSEQEDYVRTLMTGLTAIAPVYFVSGNHEWAAGWARELFDLLEELGVTVLRNRFLTLERDGAQIVLAGVDDPNGLRDQKTPEEVMEDIGEAYPGDFVVMLAHRDTELAAWSRLGTDLVLCGHAHGGLIRLPFTDGLIAPGQGWFPTWTAGVYEEGGTQMLVSRGFAGSHGCPRLFNNPEIVVAVLGKG